jgi:hypothetical protein
VTGHRVDPGTFCRLLLSSSLLASNGTRRVWGRVWPPIPAQPSLPGTATRLHTHRRVRFHPRPVTHRVCEIRWGPAREKDLVGEGASKTRLCGHLPMTVQQGSGGSSTTREGVRDAAVHVVFHDNTTREHRMRHRN